MPTSRVCGTISRRWTRPQDQSVTAEVKSATKNELLLFTVYNCGCHAFDHHNVGICTYKFIVEVYHASGREVQGIIRAVNLEAPCRSYGSCCDRHFCKLSLFHEQLKNATPKNFEESKVKPAVAITIGNEHIGGVNFFHAGIEFMSFANTQLTVKSYKIANYLKYIKKVKLVCAYGVLTLPDCLCLVISSFLIKDPHRFE